MLGSKYIMTQLLKQPLLLLSLTGCACSTVTHEVALCSAQGRDVDAAIITMRIAGACSCIIHVVIVHTPNTVAPAATSAAATQ